MLSNDLFILGAGLVIVTLIALIALFRLMRLSGQGREPRKSDPMDFMAIEYAHRAKGLRRKARGRLFEFALLVVLIAIILGAALWDWRQIDFGEEWPLAIASVTRLDVLQLSSAREGGGFDISYQLTVDYAYQVNGMVYDGQFMENAATETARDQLSNRYARGQQVVVWYHPVFPQIEFTESFGRTYNLIALAIGALLSLWAIRLLYQCFGLFATAREYERA